MIVLDTHVLVWWLADPARLSITAKKTIQASARESELIVSTASVLEIATLVRRQRLMLSMPFEHWLKDVTELPEVKLVAVTVEVAAMAGSFGAAIHGDPIDRLIIATALTLKSRLITADSNIRSLDVVRTVW